MTILSVVAHGSTGWFDEVISFGIPLVILIALYAWSARKPKEKSK